MRFDGTLKSWNDDRGFGFISPSQGGQDIFVHISACRPGGRPVLNEPLTFEMVINLQGKKRAVNVQHGNAPQPAHQPDRRHRPARLSRSGRPSLSGLKTVVALLLVAAVGWQGYSHSQKVVLKNRASQATGSREPAAMQPLFDQPVQRATSSFSCDGRLHCSQMTSCAEATYFLKNCPGVKMDGDNDGVPCEEQLCK